MERNIQDKIESYMNVDFYENQSKSTKSPFSLILDISDIKPGEIEIEDEITRRSFWFKYYKNKK
ncbi:MAG: hypothetical protein EU539_06900 [Promethearchaeota archaeon]|nr:MAG: hypothetical protein EU539_06900 [Candidatus Lokiarchaeota archaeon]